MDPGLACLPVEPTDLPLQPVHRPPGTPLATLAVPFIADREQSGDQERFLG